MNFLNPLLLYGLVGLGLPILIHQLTRQSRRDRMLPTVQFLKQASEHTRRWRKLREWLLLILRTLIITAIVFAFARPYLPGVTAGTGKQRKNNVIILVDTSASMGYQKNGSSRLRVARQKVRGLLSELGSSSTVSLIGFSDTVTEVVRKSSPDNTLIKLNKLNQSYRGTDLSRALAYASSFKKPRKVFLLSDLGKNGFSSLKDQSFPELTDDLKIIDLSLDKPRNTWVKSVRRLPGSRNKVTVKTRSSHGRKNGSLNIKTGKFSKSIPLGNSSKQSRILEVPGLPLEGQVQIKGDSFPLDNTHYFVVRGQSGGSRLGVQVSETSRKYLQALGQVELTSIPPGDNKAPSTYLVERIPGNGQSVWKTWKNYVRSGGHLVIFAPAFSGMDSPNLPRWFPVSIDGPSQSVAGQRLRVTGGGLWFSGLSSGTISGPLFFRFRPARTRSHSRKIAQFGKGTPAVASRSVGEGRVTFFNTSSDASWSNWARHPLYPVIMYRLVNQEQFDKRPETSQHTGGRISFPAVKGVKSVRMKGKSKQQLTVSLRKGVARTQPVNRPGIYKYGPHQRAVNVPPGESRPGTVSPDTLRSVLRSKNRFPDIESDDIGASTLIGNKNRSGENYWWWLLMSCLLLVPVELGLGYTTE